MTRKRSRTSTWSYLPPLSGLCLVLCFILLASRFQSSTSARFTQPLDSETRTYHLQGNIVHESINSSFHGIQQLTLKPLSNLSIQGESFWNLTWDNGLTWYAENATFFYSANRTYEFAGLACYTAWWIDPNVKIGDQIHIDGDIPVTNAFLRLTPFTVTDLLSHKVNNQHFLCWELSYDSPNHQHETYYYEYHTGILLSVAAVRLEANRPVHELWLELHTADLLPPPLPPILHYWINYNSLIIAVIGATLVTILVYYLLQRIRSPLPTFSPYPTQ